MKKCIYLLFMFSVSIIAMQESNKESLVRMNAGFNREDIVMLLNEGIAKKFNPEFVEPSKLFWHSFTALFGAKNDLTALKSAGSNKETHPLSYLHSKSPPSLAQIFAMEKLVNGKLHGRSSIFSDIAESINKTDIFSTGLGREGSGVDEEFMTHFMKEISNRSTSELSTLMVEIVAAKIEKLDAIVAQQRQQRLSQITWNIPTLELLPVEWIFSNVEAVKSLYMKIQKAMWRDGSMINSCGYIAALMAHGVMEQNFEQVINDFDFKEYPYFFGDPTVCNVIAPHASKVFKRYFGTYLQLGSLAPDLSSFSRSHMRKKDNFDAVLHDINTSLDNLKPIIISVSGSKFSIGHWVTVVGRTDIKDCYLILDGTEGALYLWTPLELEHHMNTTIHQGKMFRHIVDIQVAATIALSPLVGACTIYDWFKGTQFGKECEQAVSEILNTDVEKYSYSTYNFLVFEEDGV
ncbi:MAG: hypothetical protein KC505_10915 [Myxococcales bacterium]|nr:hypothetical protein [Myxococcales bacterium]USN50824.1 MAG: hypothetical protein H6731_11320 [Myxococcales bacterium]